MKIIIIILLISSGVSVSAQTSLELGLVKAQQDQLKSTDAHRFHFHDNSTSIIGTLFVFYKRNVSSQDYFSCNFSLSCSSYAYESITKQGIIPGLLNTFDRVTRCHGLNRTHYLIDPHSLLLIDPLHDIHYKEL